MQPSDFAGFNSRLDTIIHQQAVIIKILAVANKKKLPKRMQRSLGLIDDRGDDMIADD